ncbi:hypothetical protein fugu_018756 [Takifugu bimaculatus]|uniref:Phostensin/Taperin PP1-binding domain-containing protein n=1 Tax=Takifugu bimaculatus TaxID=433685 RepID=A0A4Z2BM64_9TELE|nr:hypothetical protein fugu_018756 [Takifugu bimaculatus]
MSVSSLPEWKQLLLERKRREEEERERREKLEEEKFASMPAWKRGIIQRRKAKQDSDKEKEKDVCLLYMDGRSASEGLSDMDSCSTNYLGSDISTSPDPGQWLDAEVKPVSEVSVETIVPVHENPFIRTQTPWRKGRDAEGGNVQEPKDREKEKLSLQIQDGEPLRGRDIESKIERFRDLSEGCQKEKGWDRSQEHAPDKSRGRWGKDKNQCRESVRGVAREWDFLKVRNDEEDKESDTLSTSLPPHVPCLRTIRADNIIIIEQDRDDKRGRQRDTEKEKSKEDHQEKSGVKVDLREILSVGGSITEIRASEVLIIKPSESPEEGNAMGRGTKSREDGEMKVGTEGRWESMGREFRSDLSWLREKEKPWCQATVVKEDRKDSLEDNVLVDRGGRVSQLLSKFGEHPKPPSRSKSSDNFLRPGRRKYSDEDDSQSDAHKGRNTPLKGVPKRSFSFSDRVICAKENCLGDPDCNDSRRRDRIRSEKCVAAWMNVASTGKETTSKVGRVRLLDKDRLGKYTERNVKNNDEKGDSTQRKDETDISIQHKTESEKLDPDEAKGHERSGNEGEGFTVASVKNTEGVSFARRVAIRQDGRARAEGEAKHLPPEPRPSTEPDAQGQGSGTKVPSVWGDEAFQGQLSPDMVQKTQITGTSAELCSTASTESQDRRESAVTECSNLPSATNRSQEPHEGLEWSSAGPQPYCALSKQTEELISKIEKIGDRSVHNNHKIRSFKGTFDMTTEKRPEEHKYGETGSENLVEDVALKSPQCISSEPLEFQIPRTVFYVVEETEKSQSLIPSNQEQNQEEGKGVERRDSWRIGKPLSRIESLREKIRQKELEKLRQRQTQDAGESDQMDVNHQAKSRDDDKRTEKEEEFEAKVQMQNWPNEAAEQALMTALDTKQEVSELKTCPQLPVSAPHSQSDKREEVPSKETVSDSELFCDSLQISEDEDDLLRHEEELLNLHWDRGGNREEEEEEETEFSEEELEEKTSPPHPNSLAAMSRIYNLGTVGSRSGLCLRERPVDIPSVHLVKVKPLLSNAQQGDSKASSGEDISGIQMIQRQIEHFHLKEQDELRTCTSTGSTVRGQQSSREVSNHQEHFNTKTQEEDEETSNTVVTPQRVQSPTSVLKQSNQTVAIVPSVLRGPSLDNALRPSDCTQTPASSPSSPSPTPSPSVSPSPSPSPTLFSIRSASGGNVKRGATITICPRKTALRTEGGGAATGAGATAADPPPSTTTVLQAPTSSNVAEPAKKKYPTVEEIEVIGGYQNLERSCLVKNKGTAKRVKVCFDEDHLEQVCEYPSESSMMAYSPHPHGLWRQEEEADADAGAFTSKDPKSPGLGLGRGVRVGKCHPLLRKHNV